jgi:hypothetical protein
MTLPSNYPVGVAIDAWIARNLLKWDMRPVVGRGVTWKKPDGEIVTDVPEFSTDRKEANHVIDAMKALGYEFDPRTRSAARVCRDALKMLEAGPPPKKVKKAAKKARKR